MGSPRVLQGRDLRLAQPLPANLAPVVPYAASGGVSDLRRARQGRIWSVMGAKFRPPFFCLMLPGIQKWDKHVWKAWPECPNVFRAAPWDRVADVRGRVAISAYSGCFGADLLC